MRYLAARMKLVDPNMTPGKRSLSVHEGFMQEMYGNGNVISWKSQRLHGSKGRYAERDGSKTQVIGWIDQSQISKQSINDWFVDEISSSDSLLLVTVVWPSWEVLSGVTRGANVSPVADSMLPTAQLHGLIMGSSTNCQEHQPPGVSVENRRLTCKSADVTW